MREKTTAEFFAGIGLMRAGLEAAGWRTIFANDIDPAKWAMYRANYGEENHFHLGDVHALDPARIPDVDLATASFPCTDLSLAGARAGLAGSQSGAFWGFIRVLETLGVRRPAVVLLENVAGFLTSHGGADFRDALLALNRLGYTVDAFVIDASHFVPQSRVRLFVVGRLDAAADFIPAPENLVSETRPPALTSFIHRHPEIRWRLAPLPPLPCRRLQLRDLLEDLPPNSALWWNRTRADYLLSQMSTRHRAQAQEMIDSPETRYGAVFRRVRRGRTMAELRIDGLAGCLRTPRGGSARQIIFAGGQGRFAVRLLTPRECARLMGADDFKITASLNQSLFGFGDAVCVPVIRWIAEHCLDALFPAEPLANRPSPAA